MHGVGTNSLRQWFCALQQNIQPHQTDAAVRVVTVCNNINHVSNWPDRAGTLHVGRPLHDKN
jgi:hypothetical protein